VLLEQAGIDAQVLLAQAGIDAKEKSIAPPLRAQDRDDNIALRDTVVTTK
jgi:hypothetical protein